MMLKTTLVAILLFLNASIISEAYVVRKHYPNMEDMIERRPISYRQQRPEWNAGLQVENEDVDLPAAVYGNKCVDQVQRQAASSRQRLETVQENLQFPLADQLDNLNPDFDKALPDMGDNSGKEIKATHPEHDEYSIDKALENDLETNEMGSKHRVKASSVRN